MASDPIKFEINNVRHAHVNVEQNGELVTARERFIVGGRLSETMYLLIPPQPIFLCLPGRGWRAGAEIRNPRT